MSEKQYTEQELEQMLDSGDMDKVNEALDYFNSSDISIESDDEADTDNDGESADFSGVDGESDPESETDSGEENKDGTGESSTPDPQSESDPDKEAAENAKRNEDFKQMRLKNESLEAEISSLRQQMQDSSSKQQGNEDAEKLQKQVEWLTKQLKDNGTEPMPLPEEFRLTDEQIEAMREDYTPEMVQTVVALQARVDSLSSQLKAKESSKETDSSPPAAENWRENPDMQRWLSDADKWEAVKAVDRLLEVKNPDYRKLSRDARLEKLIPAVKEQLGEGAAADQQSKDKPSGKPASSKAALPDGAPASLTDVGGASPTTEKSEREMLEGMSEREISDWLQKQTAKGRNVDDILAGAF